MGVAEVREGQFPSAHQLPQQSQDLGAGESLRSPLEHGAGECQGDVDRDPTWWKEEGKTREQGPFHQQTLPPWGLGDSRSQEPEMRAFAATCLSIAAARANRAIGLDGSLFV